MSPQGTHQKTVTMATGWIQIPISSHEKRCCEGSFSFRENLN